MNQEILNQPVLVSDTADDENRNVSTWLSFVPFALAILGSLALLLLRINIGGASFISDGALMMLAAADMPWVFRYIPFANLYDLSLAFAFGAGVTTLLVIRREQFKLIAALSLPLAAIILVLARFIGSEFIDLPPVLDSYWRPIHVSIASLSYGVALVCFAVAVLYLLKDGLKVEKMAVWTSIFAISVFATISKFSVFNPESFGVYTSSTFVGTSRMSLALRADIPYVGWLLVLAAALMVGSMVAFAS